MKKLLLTGLTLVLVISGATVAFALVGGVDHFDAELAEVLAEAYGAEPGDGPVRLSQPHEPLLLARRPAPE